jgi:hypothetical protein
MRSTLAILLFLPFSPALADTITLDDGRVLDGTLEPDAAREGSVRIRLEKAEMVLPAGRVRSVLPAPMPRDVYAQTLREHPPATLDEQVALARWCREKGLLAEAKAHWTAALELDAENPEVRTALGYRKVDGIWMSAQDAIALTEKEKQEKADAEVAEGKVVGRTTDGQLIVEAARKGLVNKNLRALRVGIPLVTLDIRATVGQLREMRQVQVVSGATPLSLEAPILQLTSIRTSAMVAAP